MRWPRDILQLGHIAHELANVLVEKVGQNSGCQLCGTDQLGQSVLANTRASSGAGLGQWKIQFSCHFKELLEQDKVGEFIVREIEQLY